MKPARLAETWKHIAPHFNEENAALAVKPAALVAATVAMFSQDLAMLFSDALQSETTSYMLAIPFLLIYIIYRKRKILRTVVSLENGGKPRQTRYLPTAAGVLLLITAVFVYWHGSYTFTPLEYHMSALPIFATGLTLILFNTQTLRHLAFPLAFLIFLMPPPSEILFAAGASLSEASSLVPNAIVNMVGIQSTITTEYASPSIIITRPDGLPLYFTVDAACSGIYSLIGFLVFAAFVAYIIRDKPWKKLALILLGFPLIYLLNILRITIILLIGYHYGEALALQVFHTLGGWVLVFLGTLLLLTVSEKILKTQILASKKICSQCSTGSTQGREFCFTCGRILKPTRITFKRIDAVKIAAITVSIILVLSVQTPVFAVTQGPPTVIVSTPQGQQISTELLPEIPDYQLSFAYRDTEFEATAKQDFALMYAYSPINESKRLVWAALEIASTRSSLHRWETCLITWPLSHGYQPKVTQIELKDIQLSQNPSIISRYFVFSYASPSLTEAILYWYETASFTVDFSSQQKHVKISLITYPETPEDLLYLEDQMLELAKEIANYWQPIKTWSQITMLISKNGAYLIAAPATLVALIATLRVFGTRREKRANKNAYFKLSKPNKQLIDLIRKVERETLPTLGSIAKACEATKGAMDEEQLRQKLTELEKTGLIVSSVANRNDEPVRIWKGII